MLGLEFSMNQRTTGTFNEHMTAHLNQLLFVIIIFNIFGSYVCLKKDGMGFTVSLTLNSPSETD